jgi:hypothetical protein
MTSQTLKLPLRLTLLTGMLFALVSPPPPATSFESSVA